MHVSVHRSSRLLSQCSRLEIYPRVQAVDCLHSQSTGYAQIEAISRLVLWTSRLVDRVEFLERVYDGF